MKIVAPVSSIQEVEMLTHFGCDELYCGVTTPEWETHFGGHCWMNRRNPQQANLQSWQQVKELVQAAHTKDIPVHITLNAPFYTAGSARYVLRLIDKLVSELGIDSVIVSDLNLLILLAKEQIQVKKHLSSLGGCFNSKSVDFYCDLGIKRIILPRQLKLSEIQSLVVGHPHMEFEVFAINDGCLYEESFCQTSHALGPFCLTEWKVNARAFGKDRMLEEGLYDHIRNLREYQWYQNNCGSSFQDDGFPNGPCSLCWFGHFRDWGVKAVKIVGREASFYRKMRSVQLVKAVMDQVRSAADPNTVGRLARSMRATPQHCESGHMCYFREEL